MNKQSQTGVNNTTQNSLFDTTFLTDTAKIVRRHLQDVNDVITEEDLRNVRISTDLPPFATAGYMDAKRRL